MLKTIQSIDRRTKQLKIERVSAGKHLSYLYGEGVFPFFLRHLLARIPFFSVLVGYLQKRPQSRKKIAPFICEHEINASEFLTCDFASFNDFFIRKLKPACRPIDPDPKKLTLPADGRYLAYQDISRVDGFFVKGKKFSLDAFLDSPALARRYQEGSMLIARLCPSDYHRFHFPCDGVPSIARPIAGHLYSVNPIALRKRPSILAENKRMITEIDSKHFGTILYVEVGATFVGTIHQTYTPSLMAQKGEEKGYFSFGGSCLVLLFEKGRVAIDADLLENTSLGKETYAQFGTSFGVNRR